MDFVLGLLTQPAARTIPSRIGEGSLSGDLASLYARLSQGQEEAKHIAPLLKLVFTPKSGIAPQDSDADIWTAVFDLIARTKQLPLPQPTTPPPSHPPFISSFQQTPWKFSTGAFADASENRKLVDAVLGEELLPTLRIDVPDFITAVFGHIPELDKLAETVFERCQEGETPLYTEGSGWNGWPPNAEEPLVLEWLEDLMTRIMPWTNDVNAAASRQIYNGPSTYLEGSPIKRKMDVGIMLCCGQSKTAHGKTHESKFHWAQILVTGELKSNSSEDGREGVWLDLATYAREVFRTQARRFVLGFTLCGDVMRLWHFDRSGSSGSFPFEINQEGLKFVRVMLGYHLMNDKQLGLDLTIQESDGRRYMEITRDGQCERLILTKKIKKQAVVVGRATTCWKAYCDKDQSKEPLLVKWSWQYEERSEEGELIKEATEKGARNIARYYHHETVQVDGKNDDTVENVRRGLMKTCARTWFRQRSTNEPDASAPEPLGKSVANQSRSQSQSQSHSLLQKRSSTTAQMAPQANLKRSCSSLESRNPVLPVHNRVHRLVITRDFGKPIYEASSPVALITGMIGAIKGEDPIINIEEIADLKF